MIEVLYTHIEKKVSLTDLDRASIARFFSQKRLAKRQHLLKEGQVCKHLSFVAKGLLKSFNIDQKGEKHMSMFGWEGWWISDFSSFLSQQPAFFNIDAVEDTELLQVSRADYDALMLAVPVMNRYFRILYENSIVTKERRLMSSVTHSAQEKYLALQETNPKMIERIPQKLIASYLGIAPETLSRIKKKLIVKD